MKIKMFLPMLLSIFFAGVCLANPVVLGLPSAGQYALSTSLGIIINLITDFVALFVGFLIIKHVKAIATWRFLPYFVIVFFGGIILDVVAIFPLKMFFYFIPIEDWGILIVFLVAGLLLYIFNSWLSDKFFDLENAEKVVIGLVMALLTNPAIGYILAN